MKRYRLREQMNGIAEPPGKVWFWELEAGVIHADRCIQCGTCVAVCPSNSIGIDEDTNLPELVKMCTGCSLCWDFCPRGGLRYEALWPPSTVPADEDAEVAAGPGPLGLVGHVLEDQWRPAGGRARCAVVDSYAVRASAQIDDAQDGGAVSALLIGLLAAGEIDGALVSKPSAGPRRAVEGHRHHRHDGRRGPGRLGQLLQPDDGAGRARSLDVRPAPQAAHRGGRHAVRGPGAAGHAGAALAHRRAPGRCGRADDRADVHEELRLRGADAAGAARQAWRRSGPGLEDGRHPWSDDRRVPRRRAGGRRTGQGLPRCGAQGL